MTEPSRPGDTPAVLVTRKRRFSAVWIAPILAAFAVAYMLYDGYRTRGPEIIVTFEDAEGIVAGKSSVKFEGVQIGTVKDVNVDLSSGRVTLRIRLDATARELAREGSQFWIQNPEIGVAGIAALDTLISGPYVACLTGTGDPETEFEGLAHRPPVPETSPGLRISLRSDFVGEIEPGCPVLYRGIEVGLVDRIGLSGDGTKVVVGVFIDDEHAALVRPDSSFWEISGLQVGLDLDRGVVVETDSLRSILTGAIAFESPPLDDGAAPVDDGTTFALNRHPGIGARSPSPGASDAPGSAGEMFVHLASILRKADSFDATTSVATFRDFERLAKRALDSLDDSDLLGSAGQAMKELRLASIEARNTLGGVDRVIRRDGELDQAVASVNGMAVELREAAAGIRAVLDEIERDAMLEQTNRLITRLDGAAPDLVKSLAELRTTLERIDALVAENDQPIAETIRALRDASLRLDALLEDLRANPSQLLSEPPSRTLPRRSP